VALARLRPPEGALAITERHPGQARNADFGALGELAPSDSRPLAAAEGARHAVVLAAAWAAFDEVAAAAPAQLRKGPRGGGRDTAQIVDHVLSAEAVYARKVGVPRPAKGDSPTAAVAALRQAKIAALHEPSSLPTPPGGWPLRGRRLAGWPGTCWTTCGRSRTRPGRPELGSVLPVAVAEDAGV